MVCTTLMHGTFFMSLIYPSSNVEVQWKQIGKFVKPFITFKTGCILQSMLYCLGEKAEIAGKIKPGMEDTKLHNHIVRIIVLLKRWLLQFEEGYCMGNKNKKQPDIKQFGNKASYSFGYMGNCLDHLQQFSRNSRETCLADKYIQSIGLKYVEEQWRSLLKQKSFKWSGTLLNSLKTFHAIQVDHWKSNCQASYWRNKLNVSHSSRNDHVQVEAISKAIFAEVLMESKYLVSHGQSFQHCEWWFTPVSINVIF